MEKRRLGRTGLEIGVIGFGGIPIQRVSKEEAYEILKTCEEVGMNFLDTARGYGVSESYLGNRLKESRNKWIIATKSPARDYKGMKMEIKLSLENLQTDYIDLYQCHFIKDKATYDLIMSEDGAYKALLEAQAEGKIGFIGATCHNKDILEHVVDENKFDTIQFPFNFIEDQGMEVFEKAHKKDIGILCMKPIAGGAIDRGEVSLRHIVNNPHITVAIPGIESVAQVAINAGVGTDIRPLNDEELTYIKKIKEERGSEFCRRCGYCGPCPEGLDIPLIFSLNGYLTRYELEDWAKSRYAGITQASSCDECGSCEPKCPYDLPIRKMLKDVTKNFE